VKTNLWDFKKYCENQWTYKGTGAANSGTFSDQKLCQTYATPARTGPVALTIELPEDDPEVTTAFTDAYAITAHQLYFPTYPAAGINTPNGITPPRLPPPGECCVLT
jgi:hypothetical protein